MVDRMRAQDERAILSVGFAMVAASMAGKEAFSATAEAMQDAPRNEAMLLHHLGLAELPAGRPSLSVVEDEIDDERTFESWDELSAFLAEQAANRADD